MNVDNESLHQLGILAICQALHMEKAGSSDPMADEERSAMVTWLQRRRDRWKWSECPYDAAVYSLMVIALWEQTGLP